MYESKRKERQNKKKILTKNIYVTSNRHKQREAQSHTIYTKTYEPSLLFTIPSIHIYARILAVHHKTCQHSFRLSENLFQNLFCAGSLGVFFPICFSLFLSLPVFCGRALGLFLLVFYSIYCSHKTIKKQNCCIYTGYTRGSHCLY